MRFFLALTFLILTAVPAQAETVAERRALAQFIAGRIEAVLEGTDHIVTETCDTAQVCSIIIE